MRLFLGLVLLLIPFSLLFYGMVLKNWVSDGCWYFAGVCRLNRHACGRHLAAYPLTRFESVQ